MIGDDFPTPGPARANWEHPFHWWGPGWNAPEPRSLANLVKFGMLLGWQAAWLVDHLAVGGSIIVAASPQGAGKSTLADALIAELPMDRRKVYLRGMYEPFDWVGESTSATTTILVNEISPHLPIYAWGETTRRLLGLAGAGYQVIGTIHADTVQELVVQLANYPIGATAGQLAALDVVVFLTVAVADGVVDRRVESIVALTHDGGAGGLIAQPITE